MKVVGRIILIVVGALLIAYAIPSIIDSVKALQALGGTVDWTNWASEGVRIIVALVGHGLQALAGLFAVIAAIVGKKSFGLLIAAIVMMISPTYQVVTGIQSGALTNAMEVLKIAAQYALPIAYFVGFLLV